MSKYRTHTCGELNLKNKNTEVSISGWLNKKRDHQELIVSENQRNFAKIYSQKDIKSIIPIHVSIKNAKTWKNPTNNTIVININAMKSPKQPKRILIGILWILLNFI